MSFTSTVMKNCWDLNRGLAGKTGVLCDRDVREWAKEEQGRVQGISRRQSLIQARGKVAWD